ncbi:ABC transporter substrate-binding protein [Salinirubrum litoreum]|uniref:Thiamine pyrimidine synthase n=1 Tax=Salinirubrum litoreum TaxID=1126234 RepID=A0ABD5R5K2_9EURY|nr:ABC transporter substrate-binding protein [Salinirubrum litoreum]
MADLELALDWTPNTNHTGIFVAEAEGYFADAGLDVAIRSPAEDDYGETPAKRVATGESDLAIAPSESAISYHTHPEYPDLTAVAAVCQRDTSAIVTLAESGIDRPAKLDGRTYASYDARFEDHIVRQLIRNDGGAGDIEIVTPPKLGIPNTLLDGSADATWVFVPWEGLLAERDGIDLNAFRLDDYGVPYGYTPTLLATPETIDSEADRLQDALSAIGRGYEFAVENPEEAADLLCETAEGPQLDDREFVRESQRRIAPAYLTSEGDWGVMAWDRWADFVDWLVEEGILTTLDGEQLAFEDVAPDALFTNEFVA